MEQFCEEVREGLQLYFPFKGRDTEMNPEIEQLYKKLENIFPVKSIPAFESLVNFSTRSSHPIHKWFFYREGYSPILISNCLKKERIEKGKKVIDPFCGGGTTLLESAQKGIESTGFEINRFSVFTSKVKTRAYKDHDIKNIERLINRIREFVPSKYSLPLPVVSILDKLFNEDVLNELMSYKEAILSIKEEKYRDFLLFGWLSILESVSNYRKGGNGLKKRKNHNKKSLKEAFFKKLDEMLSDIKFLNQKGFYRDFKEPFLYEDTAISLAEIIPDNKFDIAIFSPPYLNCFDYCEVYKVELWMGDFVKSYDDLRGLRKRTLTSHLNSAIRDDFSGLPDEILRIVDILKERDLWDRRIPDMVLGYFRDMKKVLSNLSIVLKSGASCIIVVGNSAYGNMVIPTDVFIGLLGEKTGFVCEGIGIARRNETSSQQQKNLGITKDFLRESLIFLRKK